MNMWLKFAIAVVSVFGAMIGGMTYTNGSVSTGDITSEKEVVIRIGK